MSKNIDLKKLNYIFLQIISYICYIWRLCCTIDSTYSVSYYIVWNLNESSKWTFQIVEKHYMEISDKPKISTVYMYTTFLVDKIKVPPFLTQQLKCHHLSVNAVQIQVKMKVISLLPGNAQIESSYLLSNKIKGLRV